MVINTYYISIYDNYYANLDFKCGKLILSYNYASVELEKLVASY